LCFAGKTPRATNKNETRSFPFVFSWQPAKTTQKAKNDDTLERERGWEEMERFSCPLLLFLFVHPQRSSSDRFLIVRNHPHAPQNVEKKKQGANFPLPFVSLLFSLLFFLDRRTGADWNFRCLQH